MRDMLTLNRSLVELHLLSGLHIPAIEELAKGIAKNSTLKVLKLGVFLKRTPVEGTCMLFRALKINTGLKHLLLSAYTLDSQGTEAAAKALEHNTALESLHLQRCKFESSDSFRSFIASLYSNKSLCELAIPTTEDVFFKLIFS